MSTSPAAKSSSPDPVRADPAHYKVESADEHVRVLRARYGPHEKSVMHCHPNTVAIFLNDGCARFNFPNERTEERSWKAGQSMLIPAEEHLPENLSDKPIELVLVELKF